MNYKSNIGTREERGLTKWHQTQLEHTEEVSVDDKSIDKRLNFHQQDITYDIPFITPWIKRLSARLSLNYDALRVRNY